MDSASSPRPITTGPRRRVGLVVDHPLRDLDGLALVAHLLARQGRTTVLVPFYGQTLDLPLLDLDLLVLNYVRPANLPLIREAQRRGIPLAVLDTEGGLLAEDGPTSPRGVARFLSRTGLDRYLSLYMFWGRAFRDVVVAETELDARRAVVTGCPRFDLAHEPWSRRTEGTSVVLVNTNFAGVNAAHAVDGEVDWLALRSVGYEEEKLQRMVAASQGIMRAMIEAVGQIAAARPDRQFVLRPHPFERADPYRQAFAGLPNLEIRREGNVLDELARSSCLLHVNCTTAVEAAMSGVPPIALEFVNHPEMRRFAEVAGQVSHPAGSVEEALALIDQAGVLGTATGIEAIEPSFGPSDGHAADRVVAAIEAILEHPQTAPAPSPRQGYRRALLTIAGQTIGSATIEALRQKFHPARRGKNLAIEEVRDALNRFARAQDLAPPRVGRVRTTLGIPCISIEIAPA